MESPLALQLLETGQYEPASSPDISVVLNPLDNDKFIFVVSRGDLTRNGEADSQDLSTAHYINDPLVQRDDEITNLQHDSSYQEVASDLNEILGEDSSTHFFCDIPQELCVSKSPTPCLLSEGASSYEKNEVESWINEVLNVASNPSDSFVSDPLHSSQASLDVLEGSPELHFWLDSSLDSFKMQDILSGDNRTNLQEGFPIVDEDTLHGLFFDDTQNLENVVEVQDTVVEAQETVVEEQEPRRVADIVSQLPINDGTLHSVVYNAGLLHQSRTLHQQVVARNCMGDSHTLRQPIVAINCIADSRPQLLHNAGHRHPSHTVYEPIVARNCMADSQRQLVPRNLPFVENKFPMVCPNNAGMQKFGRLLSYDNGRCYSSLPVYSSKERRTVSGRVGGDGVRFPMLPIPLYREIHRADRDSSSARIHPSIQAADLDQRGAVPGQHSKSPRGAKSRKQKGKANRVGIRRRGEPTMVDLRALLVNCAEAIASDDVRRANEVLHQIWLHASPFGNGMQRLAHYFAEGLVARLWGTGARFISSSSSPASCFSSSCSSSSSSSSSSSPSCFSSSPFSSSPSCFSAVAASKILQSYHLFVAVCPFLKLSHFFANQAIVHAAEGAGRLHIVDLNILYGFQWPCLIKALAERDGGPPLLRITGMEIIPGAGFEPAERVEETGRRLAQYAEAYGVPFEYTAIASNTWEDLKPETTHPRQQDEVLVVNCIHRLRHLMDESVAPASPRRLLLTRICRMNPTLFVEGVVNAGVNAPFFLSRFREALFHYSSLFDALDATVRADLEERLVIEREIMGREILNVVACEGPERHERPETYRQWQLRTERAGFEIIPLDPSIKGKAEALVKGFYHKDYDVEEDDDGRWLLLGWKGRILHGVSTWRPSTSMVQAN